MTAKATTTTVKSFTGQAAVKVTLTPEERYGLVTWTVANAETGTVYGTVESHQGHTDLTPRANTRRDSKLKTLWTNQATGRRAYGIEYPSRAAALRDLIYI